MIKEIKKILIFLSINFLFTSNLAIDISFIDLPLSANNGSLGNTFLSDIGSPTNILQNPANIWFGDRVNAKTKGIKNNIFLRSSMSSYKILDNKNFNLMNTLQIGNIATLGLAYIGSNISNIDNYNQNAEYIGNIELKQKGLFFAVSTNISGINIGSSIGSVNQDFTNVSSNDKIILSSVGLSINNKYLKVQRSYSSNKGLSYLTKLIPKKISVHATSRNIFYDNRISSNSLYKNIFGFKLDYFDGKNYNNITSIIFDYNSNNNITTNSSRIGLTHELKYGKNNKNNSLSFNLGFNSINKLNSMCYGIGYKNYVSNINFSLASVSTSFSRNFTIITLKYSYDKF